MPRRSATLASPFLPVAGELETSKDLGAIRPAQLRVLRRHPLPELRASVPDRGAVLRLQHERDGVVARKKIQLPRTRLQDQNPKLETQNPKPAQNPRP